MPALPANSVKFRRF